MKGWARGHGWQRRVGSRLARWHRLGPRFHQGQVSVYMRPQMSIELGRACDYHIRPFSGITDIANKASRMWAASLERAANRAISTVESSGMRFCCFDGKWKVLELGSCGQRSASFLAGTPEVQGSQRVDYQAERPSSARICKIP